MTCDGVWVSVPPRCNKGRLVKRECQAEDAWLIRYYGRIMYEQSFWKESEKERSSHCFLSFLSLLTACCCSSSSFFHAASFFFVRACLGIFGLPGHIMSPFWCRTATRQVNTIYLGINVFIGLLHLTRCVSPLACFCGSFSIDRLPVMVRFHIPSASCSSSLLIELNA